MAGTIRVMTWNIHGGRGLDGRRNLDRIVGIVGSQSPDIIALQEVDSRRCGIEQAFELLADRLANHSLEARIISAPDGDYGHVVLSRYPCRDVRQHDISVPGREPRAAIEATIATGEGDLHLVAAHFGLSLRERHRQAEAIAAIAEAGPPCSILLGDFNDWLSRGSVQRVLARHLPARTHQKTFPSVLPILSLDRIYARPAGLVTKSWVVGDAGIASDHLPLMAELALPGRACG